MAGERSLSVQLTFRMPSRVVVIFDEYKEAVSFVIQTETVSFESTIDVE
ncbi:MAG: hypothetical protein ACTSYL_09075 [Candidatus Thorarchaeota archaeon]